MSVLFVECHDSFSGMIVDYLRQLSNNVVIVDHEVPHSCHSGLDPESRLDSSFRWNDITHLVLGPGPGTPQSSGHLMGWLEAGVQSGKPVLGICLGHQAIGVYFGATLERAPRAIHGEAHVITHSERGLFTNVPQNTRVTRYHSLVLKDLPEELKCEARSEDGQIMAIRHISKPIYGIQFHPESFLSEQGFLMIQNFLASSRAA